MKTQAPPTGSSPGASPALSGLSGPRVLAPPTEEEIRRRAYERYLERGCAPGDPTEDWLQAEWELKLGRC